MYRVNDIFHSIQGEGYFMGTPATFIRLQGCPVGCPWCDTQDSWGKGGTKLSAAMISKKVQYPHIIITGGEPMIQNLDHLIRQLEYDHECFIQLETCGAFDWLGIERPDYVTVSPKARMGFQVVVRPDELKFVVDGALQEDVVKAVVNKWHDVDAVSFMPEGAPPTKISRERAYDFAMHNDLGVPVLYSDRLQYILEVK